MRQKIDLKGAKMQTLNYREELTLFMKQKEIKMQVSKSIIKSLNQ